MPRESGASSIVRAAVDSAAPAITGSPAFAGDDAAEGNDKKMTGPEVLDVARDSITTLVLVASPLMLVGLAVGVAISLFQALTQIQEMTLVFVPKILAIFVAMLLALPFMADALQGHMARLAARIVGG
jgi:flagellar biosynthetic protein FliQ